MALTADPTAPKFETANKSNVKVGFLVEDEEEDEDLFEINLEAVNEIFPAPDHYWESYFTAATSKSTVLLANCLLPITDVSKAIPVVMPCFQDHPELHLIISPLV